MPARRNLVSLLALVFAALLVAVPSTAFGQTLVPVNCTGVPVNDGANLLAAYNGVVGAGPASPFVVQPEPCLYDLGNNPLVVKDFVDLIGLGRNDTIITSQVDRSVTPNTGTIVVPPGVDAELANLTLRNEDTLQGYVVFNESFLFVMEDVILEASSKQDAVALLTRSRARLIDGILRATVFGGASLSPRAVGLEDEGGSSVITDTLMTFAGSECNQGFGARIVEADTTLENVTIFGTCFDATGILVSDDSFPTVNNSKATVSAQNVALGLDVPGTASQPRVNDTLLTASATDVANAVRMINTASFLRMANVTGEALDAATRVGLQATAGRVTADRSTFIGKNNSMVVGGSATVKIGVTKLDGPRLIVGGATCVGTYDGAYGPIGPGC